VSVNLQKYGIIKSVRIVRDLEDKSSGYGFVEFDNKEDFATAYKNANYRKIDGSKIIVDFERGRTMLSWRPRRFGGGKGYLRLTK
jgi:U1 small nuclear ribonucleoprotein 70kDa